jgi:hypothetical protein
MPKQIVRKLTRLGTHSYYVLIPPDLIRKLKWKERQKLVIKPSGQSIKITDWKKK